MTTRTITGTDYTATSTTSLDSILNPTGPQPAYSSFQLWLNDVDRLCCARLGHGALMFRTEEQAPPAMAIGAKEMYWYIDAQAAQQAESN